MEPCLLRYYPHSIIDSTIFDEVEYWMCWYYLHTVPTYVDQPPHTTSRSRKQNVIILLLPPFSSWWIDDEGGAAIRIEEEEAVQSAC